jgi:hypothetical protein
MRADFSGAEEGAVAVLKSRVIDESDSIKCINFQSYIHGNKNPGSLKVKSSCSKGTPLRP